MDGGARYRFLSVVGEGGFGRVYRARLEAGGGFHKDVAVKVLTDPEPPKRLLQQFRDEARILGLVRDRAFVGVDPPIQIQGRWAVVMEFVDGMSCAELLARKPIPPGVAVEIVGEIARGLHHAFHMAGPNGEPLQLLHRDIKPENVQVTPTGEVKLLDFGIARANFSEREFKTRHSLGGTPGYIAPERLHGQELPAGDVYSLGVLLHTVITAVRPKYAATINIDEAGLPALGEAIDHDLAGVPQTMLVDEGAKRVLALAAWMRAEDPGERPTARQVEEVCRTLRMALPAPFLREWAEAEVQHRAQIDPDERVGQVYTVDGAMVSVDTAVPPMVAAPPPTDDGRTKVALGALLGGGAAVAGGGAVLVLLAMIGIAWSSGMLGTGPPTAAAPSASTEIMAAPAPSASPAPPPMEPPAAPEVAPPAPAAPDGPTASTKPSPSASASAAAPSSGKVDSGGGPKVITVIPVGASAAPTAATTPAPAASSSSAPTGKVVVKTIPSGATVKRKGEALAGAGGVYTLPIGTHVLYVTSPAGESTSLPVVVKADDSVSICYNFDTNSSCAP
jgi:hypothetical protein